MTAWDYFLFCFYTNYYTSVPERFSAVFITLPLERLKDSSFPDSVCRGPLAVQKEQPVRHLSCLSLLSCLDLLGPFPHTFKRHSKFSGRTLLHLNFSFSFVYLSNALLAPGPTNVPLVAREKFALATSAVGLLCFLLPPATPVLSLWFVVGSQSLTSGLPLV